MIYLSREAFIQRLHRRLAPKGIVAKGGKGELAQWAIKFPDGATRTGLDFEAMIELAREFEILAPNEDVPR